jgi:hypothetical protein
MAVQELVSAPAKVAQYAARRSELRLVKVGVYPIYGPGGQKVGDKPGETVEFRNGLLTVDLTQDETAIAAGRSVPTEELVEWLERHRLLGDREEGFFKVEIAAPAISDAEMGALMDAAVNLDTDKLQAILEAEQQGWQREAIINNATRSLASIEALHAKAAEEQPETTAKGDNIGGPAPKAKPKAD